MDDEIDSKVEVVVIGPADAPQGLAPCGLPKFLVAHLYGPNFGERCDHCAELNECCGIKRAADSGVERGPMPLLLLVARMASVCDKKSAIVLTGPFGSAIMAPGGSCNTCIARDNCSKSRRSPFAGLLEAIYDMTIGQVFPRAGSKD